MAEVSGFASDGIYSAEWIATTNETNTQITVTATQKRVSDGALVSGPGQQWFIQVLDDGDVQRSFDLWNFNGTGVVIANQGPKTRAFRAKVLAGIEDLDISTQWKPPSTLSSIKPA